MPDDKLFIKGRMENWRRRGRERRKGGRVNTKSTKFSLFTFNNVYDFMRLQNI
jgi:hypothetical protein